MTSTLRHLGSEDPQLSCSSTNQVPASQPSATEYHQQTVTLTALTLKLSLQIPQVAHLCGNSCREDDNPLSCSETKNGRGVSGWEKINVSSQVSPRGLFFPHLRTSHDLQAQLELNPMAFQT